MGAHNHREQGVTRSDSLLWTVITVTHNSSTQLRRCWARADFDARLEWVVVDNASEDDSAAVARRMGARVIELNRNVGFGAANNLGLARIRSPWTAFVNPDVVIGPFADFMRLAAVSEVNGAIVAPQLLSPDGSEQPNGRGLPYPLDKLAHRSVSLPGSRLGDYTRIGLPTPTFVAWTMGAAISGPTDVFRQLGGWDERYFIYYEDHDLGLRSWEAGFPVVVDPHVRWIHEWQRDTTRIRFSPWRHEIQSAWAFYRNHPGCLSRRWTRDVEKLIRQNQWKPAKNVQ